MNLLKNYNSPINSFVLLAFVLILFGCASSYQIESSELFKDFQNPPDKYRPWVFWHWTNGNVTREGITKDLESMKEVGIGGVITFRLSGPRWAPAGPLKTGMNNQLPMIRFAAEEADRLGLEFSLVADYGYGTGGDSRECEHSSPIVTEQSPFSNKKESLRIDFMTITFRNEVLSPSWNGMLPTPWYEMLNATGISSQTPISQLSLQKLEYHQ